MAEDGEGRDHRDHPDHRDHRSWRRLLAEAEAELHSALDARRIIERASGRDGADLVLALDDPAPRPAAAHAREMVRRRAGGEPLQYVVGRWQFRQLELYVDRRVLIPRPETEVVVEIAIAEVAAGGTRDRPLIAADLGTGSGAIALSLAVELPAAEVWATDRSADALAVARANLAGAGRAAARVRLVEGDWFAALPGDLRGAVDVAVTNPPYIAEGEDLPAEVAAWEPVGALVAGPTGLEAVERIVADAPAWLADGGVLVCEIAPHQADAVAAAARAAGFGHVDVRPDLTGRLRALVAR